MVIGGVDAQTTRTSMKKQRKNLLKAKKLNNEPVTTEISDHTPSSSDEISCDREWKPPLRKQWKEGEQKRERAANTDH